MIDARTISLAWVFCCSASLQSSDKLNTVLESLLASRLTITSYHIQLDLDTIEGQGDTASTQSLTLEVWKSGQSLRTDVKIRASSSQNNDKGQRRIYCTSCDKAGYTTTTVQGSQYVAPLSWIEDKGAPGQNNPYHADWRLFAIAPGELYPVDDKRIKKYFSAYTELNDANVVYTKSGNVRKYNVFIDQYTSRETWFDESHFLNPTYCRIAIQKSKENPVNYEATAKVTYSRSRGNTIDYPASLLYRFTKNDSELIAEYKATVTLCELNTDIPASVFLIENFGILNGTPVLDPNIKNPADQPTWQNGKIDYSRTRGQQATEAQLVLSQQSATPDTPQPSFLARVWPYLLGAAVLAGVGFILIRRSRRSA